MGMKDGKLEYLFATSIIQTIFLAQYFHKMFVLGMRIKASVTSAVYRKALKISNAARKESTTGEIVNLMSVDVQRLMDLVAYLNMLWSAPFQIGVALYFLWDTLGPSVLSGVAVMILLIPVNGWLAGKVKNLHGQQMKNKDNRVKLMSEILSGIKVLKLYAWELSFKDQVHKIRDREMIVLRKAAFLNAGTTFLWFCAPFVVALVTFATYVLVDEENVLDSEKAFVALTLFNIMSMPMTMLPMMIVMSAEASVSLKRLGKYLNAEEIDEDAVQHDSTTDDPVVIEDGDFAWEAENKTLTNINVRIKPGQLVAVVGIVGSGKSSLIASLLGELIKLRGKVVTKGSIAYVAQQAWIRNCTLKDNITFGKPFDKQKYNNIIDCCALKPDLDILPAGDQTEIGEKGVNLSGGQKQRLTVTPDVYLFDDPLSAVDSHVGKHIFDKMLGPQGLLAGKTRLLVTHGITYLPQTDHIIVLKDGQISEEGTYKQLLAKKGAFADFLVQHLEASEVEMKNSPMLLWGYYTEKRTTSVRSQDSSGHTPSPAKRMSITPKKEEVASPQKVKDKLIEVEKAETGSVKGDVYTHYFKAVGIFMVFMTMVFSAVSQAFQIGGNAWLSKWSEEPQVNGTIDVDRRNMFLGVYAALGVAQSIAVVIGSIMMAIGMLKASAKLHNGMLLNVLRSSASFFDTTPQGRIVNRFAKDVDVVDNQLPMNVRSWLRCFFQVFGTIAVISYSTPIFLAVIVPLGIVYFLIQRFYVATSRQLKRLESITRSPIYSHFGETLTGATTIRAYSKQMSFILESEDKVDHNQRSYFPSIVANRWLAVRLETVGNLIIFFAGLFAVLGRDTLDPGTVGLSISYALSITQTLNWLVRMTSDVETNIVAVERIKEYSETPQEAEWEIPERKPDKEWPEKGLITFDHYQTRYREGLDLVLRDVTCTIEPGEKVGIVGRTGAGKSSLTLGLFRLIEAAGGNIIIDGHNISKLGLHDVRGRLTIIPQDPVLFSGNLRFNLDPFGAYSDDEIWRVLELAHLKTFVSSLTAGLDHEISEGGENLSVGQRSLVCLGRALLRKTKILVLDEATAAVDLETDDLIQTTIRSAFKECTVLTIAHRLNTIMDSTRVMVLDKGEIREFDTPSSLLHNKKTIFYGMAKDAGIVN
ncbi:Multidrug resistance-associated protein 1 [Orchesella cincta]|uniref:ABC-type glutathione-S-conjugate transporter n=1 Tax=Orchesella cincta TaxID=48709 RepID=A0A1D2M8D9_ORCCI|nr:Multidrug resistance-associated protein 1 [Orchesella cincta]